MISAQVTISQFMGSSPTSGSALTVWSLLGILSLSLSLPLPPKNKEKEKASYSSPSWGCHPGYTVFTKVAPGKERGLQGYMFIYTEFTRSYRENPEEGHSRMREALSFVFSVHETV